MKLVINMDTFCLLAYIPCIILIAWLLIEIRRFVLVNKRLRQTQALWNKVQTARAKKSSRGDEHFIETIPLPQAGYTSEYSSDYYPSSTQRMKTRERRPISSSRRQRDYDGWEYSEEIHTPARPPSARRRRRPPPPDTYSQGSYRDRYTEDYDPRPRRR